MMIEPYILINEENKDKGELMNYKEEILKLIDDAKSDITSIDMEKDEYMKSYKIRRDNAYITYTDLIKKAIIELVFNTSEWEVEYSILHGRVEKIYLVSNYNSSSKEIKNNILKTSELFAIDERISMVFHEEIIYIIYKGSVGILDFINKHNLCITSMKNPYTSDIEVMEEVIKINKLIKK